MISLRVKEESEKAGLKFNIQKTEIIVSHFSHFMVNRRGKMETGTDFIFLHSQIASGDDCSHEIKRCLLLGRKAMMNLDSIFKSRDTWPTTVHIVKAMLYPVLMYGCESWTMKQADC